MMMVITSTPSLLMMLLGTASLTGFSMMAQSWYPSWRSAAQHPAGALVDLGGWQTVYWLASALMVVMAVIYCGLPCRGINSAQLPPTTQFNSIYR
ncbi:hypothetical protein [Sodalis sp.]|uniref:hypothetical protein n=1 Tax=Sodalis sp. (in: enterobacteria) TaxID=1898979 RepID=UPI003872EBFC